MEPKQSKTICLITPGHLSSDPRLIKEAIALFTQGFHIHLIFTQYVKYLVDFDNQLLAKYPLWTFDILNWTGDTFTSKIIRYFSSIKYKLSKYSAKTNIAFLTNRHYYWQLRMAIKTSASLYIAHNLGALAVAVGAAEKNKSKCGFDAEDFHRYETTDDLKDKEVILKQRVEDMYIPKLDYMTSSSTLIAEKYAQLYTRDVLTVLNVFPRTTISSKVNLDEPLKIFWFSQTIGINRGLENIIHAISKLRFIVQLVLLGKIESHYLDRLNSLAESLQLKSKISFYESVFPDDLFKITANFDIGIASEPGFSINNDIALSNKLFTYIQCGLVLIASSTTAQKQFINQFPDLGKLYHNNDELASLISFYNDDRQALNLHKEIAFNLGQKQFNWEIESQKLIIFIVNLLGEHGK